MFFSTTYFEINNCTITRYSTGKQSEADESVYLIFLPINKIETWSFDDAEERNQGKFEDIQRRDNAFYKENFPGEFSQIYSQMAWGCRGGMRLLYLHIQNSNELN